MSKKILEKVVVLILTALVGTLVHKLFNKHKENV